MSESNLVTITDPMDSEKKFEVKQPLESALLEFTNDRDMEMMRVLLQLGVDPNKHNSSWEYQEDRPLLWAIAKKDTEMIQLLLDYGADPSLCLEGMAKFVLVDQEILELLPKNNPNIDWNVEILITAITRSMYSSVPKIIEKTEIDINRQNGWALLSALKRNDLKMAKILVQHGADVTQDEFLRAALICAFKSQGKTDVFDFLFQNGAKLTKQNSGKILQEALHALTFHSSIGVDESGSYHNLCKVDKFESDIVKYLLEKGGDVHYQEEKPLIFAVRRGCDSLIKLLLEHGANVKTRNDEIVRIIDVNERQDLLEILQKYGLICNKEEFQESVQSSYYETAPCSNTSLELFQAVRKGQVEKAQELLEKVHVWKLEQLLAIAVARDHFPMVRLLCSKGAKRASENIYMITAANENWPMLKYLLQSEHEESMLHVGKFFQMVSLKQALCSQSSSIQKSEDN